MTNGDGGGAGGGAARRWFQDYLDVFVGWAGLLFAVFFVTEPWPLRLGILVAAGLLTWMTLEIVGGRLLTRARARHLVVAVLAVTVLAVFVIDATVDGSDYDPHDAGRDDRGNPPTAPLDCPSEAGDLAAGERDVEAAAYSDAFHAAYLEAGGREELGCPINLVNFTFGAGVHQNFDRGGEQGALLAVDLDSVVWVEPSVSRCVDRAAGVPGDIFRNTAYPREGPRELEGGWVLELGYSRSEPARPNAVVWQEDGDRCTWVTHDFWLTYEALGGPEGDLGYPTGNNRRNSAAVEEQRFEHGCLARPGAEIVPAPCTTELAYKVAAPADSISVPTEPGGYAALAAAWKTLESPETGRPGSG